MPCLCFGRKKNDSESANVPPSQETLALRQQAFGNTENSRNNMQVIIATEATSTEGTWDAPDVWLSGPKTIGHDAKGKDKDKSKTKAAAPA